MRLRRLVGSAALVVTSMWHVDVFAQSAASEQVSASLLQVRLYPSRAKPTAGTGLGVQADLENRSSVTVYVRSEDVRLTLPPELQGPLNREREGLPALLPTEGESGATAAPSFVALRPNDSYTVFWRADPSKAVTGGWSILWPIIDNELNFMFFAPGEYRLVADVKYWTEPGFGGTSYRTVRQEAVLEVAAPVFVILFGAALGGLIAYFVFPDIRARRTVRRQGESDLSFWVDFAAKEIGAVAGSVFLSVITTILLSRIAESQFLVRVTVNDFWGAIAVGFVANFVGYNALEKYLKQTTSKPDPERDRNSHGHPDHHAPPDDNDKWLRHLERRGPADVTARPGLSEVPKVP